MTKDEIFEVLKKNTVECLEDIEPEEVTIDKTLEDVGATSLDMIEIVSLTMRELKVKIPRKELEDLSDIQAVVDRLDAAMREPA